MSSEWMNWSRILQERLGLQMATALIDEYMETKDIVPVHIEMPEWFRFRYGLAKESV